MAASRWVWGTEGWVMGVLVLETLVLASTPDPNPVAFTLSLLLGL